MTKPKSTTALSFLEHEAAGGIVLLIAAMLALVAANTALAPYLRRVPRYPRRRAGRCAEARQAAAAVDQRRADGDLLLPGRARDQARGSGRRTVQLRPGSAAGDRGARRHDRAGGRLSRHRGRGSDSAGRLGHSGRDRHRIRGGRAGAARRPRSDRAQDFPAGAGDHRRSRRDRDHRAVLYGQSVAAVAGHGGGRHRRAGRCSIVATCRR